MMFAAALRISGIRYGAVAVREAIRFVFRASGFELD